MESSTATAGSTTTRPKATPDFRVFEEREDGLFELLTREEPEQAANKKAAIRAVAGESEGRFLAIRDKEYNVLQRKVEEVQVVTKAKETWS